jgi:hypothetical protein
MLYCWSTLEHVSKVSMMGPTVDAADPDSPASLHHGFSNTKMTLDVYPRAVLPERSNFASGRDGSNEMLV